MPIIVTRNGKDAIRLERTKFVDEQELQEYLFDNPDVVPIYEIDENKELLILTREFSTKSGPIDALGVDIEGNIYIVETKLYKNTDKRFVIAQVLDYGAAMWADNRDYSDFYSRLERDVGAKFNLNLDQKLSNFFGIESDAVEALLENVRENLEKGTFKFIVLMDDLSSSLKDLIRYINQNSYFSIYAVELEYYKFDNNELMIPKLFGAEITKTVSTASKRRVWDETSFLQEMNNTVEKKYYEELKSFYEFSRDYLLFRWGSGKVGAFGAGIANLSDRTLFTMKSNGQLSLNLGWHKDENEKLQPFVIKLITQLNEIGFSLEEGEPKQHYYYYELEEWFRFLNKFKTLLLDLKENQ